MNLPALLATVVKPAAAMPAYAAWRQLRRLKQDILMSRTLRARMSTARSRLLPNTIILGAQKAGTTALFDRLAAVPGVLVSCVKEVHYFDLGGSRGLDWYRAHFPLDDEAEALCRRGIDPIVLEASPYYLFHPAVPGRMAAALPNARFIVLLREPLTRAWSHYWHERSRGFEWRRPEVAFEREESRLAGESERLLVEPDATSFRHRHFGYLARSRYAEQLRRWFHQFPPERFLILKAEDLFGKSKAEMQRLQAFLDLPEAPARQTRTTGARNAGEYPPLPHALRDRLAERLEPANRELEAMLGLTFTWH